MRKLTVTYSGVILPSIGDILSLSMIFSSVLSCALGIYFLVAPLSSKVESALAYALPAISISISAGLLMVTGWRISSAKNAVIKSGQTCKIMTRREYNHDYGSSEIQATLK